MSSVAPSQRFTKQNPCPKCGGWQSGKGAAHCYGFWLEDNKGFICTQGPSDTYSAKAEGWLHFTDDKCSCGQPHVGITPATGAAAQNCKPPQTWPGRQYLPKNLRIEGDNYTFTGEWEFHRPDGSLAYIERRYERPNPDGGKSLKAVRPFTPRADGSWVMARECEPLLWNLPALLSAPIDAPIYLVEGPRKAQLLQAALRAAGAAGVVTSAKSGPASVNLDVFAGYRLIPIPDHDEAGEKHMAAIAARAFPIAAQVCYLRLPDLPEKGDVVEYLAAHPVGDLVRLANMATPESLNSTPTSQDEGSDAAPNQWRERALRAEEQNKRIAEERAAEEVIINTPNAKMSAPAKLVAIAMRRERYEMEANARPDERDAEGRPPVAYWRVANRAGVKPGAISNQAAKLEAAGVFVTHKTTEIGADGLPRTKVYVDDGPNAIPRNPDAIPDPPRANAWGGKRTRKVDVPTVCIACGGVHLDIRAEAHCLDCGTVEPLNLNRDEQEEQENDAPTSQDDTPPAVRIYAPIPVKCDAHVTFDAPPDDPFYTTLAAAGFQVAERVQAGAAPPYQPAASMRAS